MAGNQTPTTAEQLMRSRYSAFCVHNEPYLKRTWHPTTCPETIDFDDQQHWLGLKIISRHDGGVADSVGQVEFVARYKIHGRAYRLHENSDFVKQNGCWQYTQGTLL